MASYLQLLLFSALLLLLLAVAPHGGAQPPCGLQSIQVNQHTTGARQGLDSEFEVEIKNACGCAVKNVRVYAPGFASQKPVDPRLFRPDGDAFLVYGGNPIAPGAAVTFSYWWDHASYFSPAASLNAC